MIDDYKKEEGEVHFPLFFDSIRRNWLVMKMLLFAALVSLK